ncbi:MAG: hypothetical protein ACFB0B_10875 [Thermonemataceae bacterium]
MKKIIIVLILIAGITIENKAQVSFKDEKGNTQVTMNEKGEIFFQGELGARVEEYGKNGKHGQNVRFYGKDGQQVANYVAKKKTLFGKEKEVLATVTDTGLKDEASGKTMRWSEEGVLMTDAKKMNLFLDPNDELIKDRTLMIAYLIVMGAEITLPSGN